MKKIFPFITGFIFNVIGFIIGSNFFLPILLKNFTASGEYAFYVIWSISGLILSCLGNLIGILIFSTRNILKTFIGAIIGLFVGIIFAFIPMLFWIGILTIFTGIMIGHGSEKQT